jgi:hypothetical protein
VKGWGMKGRLFILYLFTFTKLCGLHILEIKKKTNFKTWQISMNKSGGKRILWFWVFKNPPNRQ